MQQQPASQEPAPHETAPQTELSENSSLFQKKLPYDNLDKQLSSLDRFRLSPFYEKINEKKKDIGYFFLCFILAIFLIVILISRSNQNKTHDAHLADLYANELKKTAKIFEEESALQTEEQKSHKELFTSLLKIAHNSPEVEKLYAGLIAQELLLSNNKEANTFAQSAIATLQKNQLNLFARFSEITLLSSQNLLKEALEKANALADEKELQNTTTLYACTLLQKQNLEKALGFEDACEKTKEKLASFLKTDKVRETAKLEPLFKDGNHSIFDFK